VLSEARTIALEADYEATQARSQEPPKPNLMKVDVVVEYRKVVR